MAKARKLPSGSWRVQASVTLNGEHYRRSFTDTSAKRAQKLADEWQEHLKMIGSDFTRMTVKEAIDFYISTNERRLSPSTVKEYVRIANNDMQDIINKPLYSLTCPIIDNSINKAIATLSPKTIKNRYGLLQRILSVYHPSFIWAVKYPEARPKIKREFSHEYVKSILKAVKDDSFELEVYLGMLSLRESEICGVMWSDFDFSKKTLTVCRTKLLDKNNEYIIREKNKTGGSTRITYLPDYVCTLVKKRKAETNCEFLTEVPPHSFWDKFNSILTRNNIEPLNFHGLRHIYSSLSSSLGIDAQIRMENGGWSSERIMDGNYRHSISEAQIDANKKMNNYINNAIDFNCQPHRQKRLRLVRHVI